jgi:flagellar L-ring protein precursor FlgH
MVKRVILSLKTFSQWTMWRIIFNKLEAIKILLFAHSRSASVHCSEAPAIPNVLLGMTQLKHWETMFGRSGGDWRFAKPLIVKSLFLIKCCAKVSLIFFIPLYGCSKSVDVNPNVSKVNYSDEVSNYNEALSRKHSPSLWTDVGNSGTLFLDYKGRTLGDIVIVRIVESSSASNSNTTKTSKSSQYNAGITNLFGLPLDFGMDDFLDQGNPFSPTIATNTANTFNGQGSKKKSDTVQATIAARIVDILPSGNLVIEGNREIIVDQEKQTISVKGIIRQKDIDANNTVLSTAIADAQISYSGKGVLSDANRKGWLANVVDWIWPF